MTNHESPTLKYLSIRRANVSDRIEKYTLGVMQQKIGHIAFWHKRDPNIFSLLVFVFGIVSSMKRFSYTVGVMGADWDVEDIHTQLNKMGQRGWELVGVTAQQHDGAACLYHFFKREVLMPNARTERPRAASTRHELRVTNYQSRTLIAARGSLQLDSFWGGVSGDAVLPHVTNPMPGPSWPSNIRYIVEQRG